MSFTNQTFPTSLPMATGAHQFVQVPTPTGLPVHPPTFQPPNCQPVPNGRMLMPLGTPMPACQPQFFATPQPTPPCIIRAVPGSPMPMPTVGGPMVLNQMPTGPHPIMNHQMIPNPTPLLYPHQQFVNAARQIIMVRTPIPQPAPVFVFPPPQPAIANPMPVQMAQLPIVRAPDTSNSTQNVPAEPISDMTRPSNPATPNNANNLDEQRQQCAINRRLNTTSYQSSRLPVFRNLNRSLPQIIDTLPGGELWLNANQRYHIELDLSPINSKDNTRIFPENSFLLPSIREESEPDASF